MMPRPSLVFIRSLIESAGSPKNLLPPWFSRTRSWRCTAPTVALATLPYFCAIVLEFFDR